MKKKYKWIVILAVILAGAASYAAVLAQPVEAEAEQVSEGNLEESFTVEGTVLPVKSTVLNSDATGEVRKLPWKPGMAIPEGEAVCLTGNAPSADLDIRREQLNQQLEAARQEYDRMFGKNGAAKSNLEAAKSEYELAERNYSNAKVLAGEGGIVSQSELETLKTQRDLTYQKYLQAEADQSKERENYYLGQIDSCEKQLAAMENTLNPGTVKMPYDGVLWELYTEEGAYVASNQPVAKVYKPGEMKLSVSLLSEDALLLSPGQIADVRYADGTEGQAEISFLSPVASRQISSVGLEENRCEAELTAENVPERAGAGQKADVTFTAVAARDVLSVPSTAIVPDGKNSVLYLVRGNKAVPVSVTAGRKSGGRVEILYGLSKGDVVISDPYGDGIKKGTRVKARVAQRGKE